MATFLARIKVSEGKGTAFEEVARNMFRDIHTQEPSCRRYEYWRGAEPRTYYCAANPQNLTEETVDHDE